VAPEEVDDFEAGVLLQDVARYAPRSFELEYVRCVPLFEKGLLLMLLPADPLKPEVPDEAIAVGVAELEAELEHVGATPVYVGASVTTCLRRDSSWPVCKVPEPICRIDSKAPG